jgi:hypothetical protein
MRFITEFELEPNRYAKYPHLIIKSYKSLYEAKIGDKIAEAFGWDEKGTTTITGPVKEHFKLEIEAFPIDKWVEFKKRLQSLFINDMYGGDGFSEMKNLIEDLESFGNPVTSK